MNSSFVLFVDSQLNLSMMNNNLAIQTNSSEQENNTLRVAYKKTTLAENVVSEPEITTPETVNPVSRKRGSKKNTEKYYRQLVPVKIYNKLPVLEEAIKPHIKGYKTVHLLQIVSIVAWHIRKDEGFARLHLKYLKDQVKQADKYLKELISNKIIIRTGHPIKGVKCYEYSFAPEWQSKCVAIPLNDMYLIWRLEQLQIVIEKEQSRSIRGHSRQKEFLKQITIDAEFDKFMESNWTGNENQYNNIKASATRIINRDYFCKRDDTSKRFHSNITNMSRDLRSFLRVNGKPLVNIDIKNSQPYLSSIILTDPKRVACFAKDEELKKLLMTIKIPKSPNIALYIELVTSGTIYEYLVDEFLKEGLELTRDDTKKQVLRTLYARNRKPENEVNRQAREIFIDRFPGVDKVFSQIRGHGKGEKFTTYKRFAILLQRIESYLVLDVIMKRVYKELPGDFAMTIHDSILTVNDREVVDSIFKIMEEELEKFVGYPPRLKKEGFFEEI